MTIADIGALLRAVAKAAQDWQANKPLAPRAAPTGASLADGARQLQSALPSVIAYLDAHPGAITAAEDVLEALSAGGLTWAAPLETAASAAPSAFRDAEKWLPLLIGLLSSFGTAPRPGPPIAADDWTKPFGQDPRAANPSGAVGQDWTRPDP